MTTHRGPATPTPETGDLHRFTSSRAVVKPPDSHRVDPCPEPSLDAPASAGRPPALAAAAWRAVWDAVKSNPVYAERYRHLTTRETNKLEPTQAQTILAGAILRQLHAVITTGQAWDPDIATYGARNRPTTIAEVAA